jgi:CubicO group peptidase (beta-lactamase class C family)
LVIPCLSIAVAPLINASEITQGMVESYPVGEPEERPVYSNIAFTLLAYAMQERTGKNYSELLSDMATGLLGMSSTMVSPGEDSMAVIPQWITAGEVITATMHREFNPWFHWWFRRSDS